MILFFLLSQPFPHSHSLASRTTAMWFLFFFFFFSFFLTPWIARWRFRRCRQRVFCPRTGFYRFLEPFISLVPRLYMTICSFSLRFSPRVLSRNSFSQYVPPSSHAIPFLTASSIAYHLVLPPSIVLHPFFGQSIVPLAGSRTQNNAPIPGSFPSPWMNAVESLGGMEETRSHRARLVWPSYGSIRCASIDDEDEGDDDPVWPRFIDHAEDLDTGSTELCGSSRLRSSSALASVYKHGGGELYLLVTITGGLLAMLFLIGVSRATLRQLCVMSRIFLD